MDITYQINQHKKFFVFLPAVLALLCFANTFGYEFVYDDLFQIVDANSALGDWSKENIFRLFDRDIWAFFKQHFPSDAKSHSQYYRPIFGLAFMLNHLYGGVNPFAWHLTSVVLHMLAVVLSYKVICDSFEIIFPENKNFPNLNLIALLTSCCFAIHPAQSESVAWVSAYVNALTSIFIFITIIFYFKLIKSYKWLPISLFSYFLALLTKESAIILPFLLVGYEVFLTSHQSNFLDKFLVTTKRFSPFVIVTLIYFYIRVIIFGAIKAPINNSDFPQANLSYFNYLITLPSILLSYLKILFWPFSNNPMYENRLVLSPDFTTFYLPVTLLFFLLLSITVLVFKHKLIQLSLIWLIVPLLPVLDLRSFKPEDLLHDRYLYLSTIGFGIFISFLVILLNTKLINQNTIHPITLLFILIMIAVMSIITVSQNYVWADEWQLWTTAHQNVPNSCIVNTELGRLSEEKKKDDKAALLYYQKALSFCPNSLILQYKLGLLYGRNGDLINSEKFFKNMLELTQNRFILSTAYFNLGLISEKRGDIQLALNFYNQGLKLNPDQENSNQVRQIVKELTEKLSTN